VIRTHGPRLRERDGASASFDRSRRSSHRCPWDCRSRRARDQVTSYPGVTTRPGHAATANGLLTAIEIDTEQITLRLYTTISSLAATGDVTLEELRLETLLPADNETAEALRLLAT